MRTGSALLAATYSTHFSGSLITSLLHTIKERKTTKKKLVAVGRFELRLEIMTLMSYHCSTTAIFWAVYSLTQEHN